MALTETQVSAQLCEWFRANGLDPSAVRADSRASIADGQLSVRVAVRPNGHDVIDPNNPNDVLTETVTVPVVVPPTPFVREWLRRGAPSPEQYRMALSDAERVAGLTN
jgi:hypothetical protein